MLLVCSVGTQPKRSVMHLIGSGPSTQLDLAGIRNYSSAYAVTNTHTLQVALIEI